MNEFKVHLIFNNEKIKEKVNEILRRKYNIVNIIKDADVFITDSIPDDSNKKYFLVVWDKHNIDEIEKKLGYLVSNDKSGSKKMENCMHLRGIFLIQEIIYDENKLINCIEEIKNEIQSKNDLMEQAEEIKNNGECYEIGSMIKLTESEMLEDMFSKPRFNALVTDKPMLELMRKLTYFLFQIEPSLKILKDHYKNYIKQVKDSSQKPNFEFEQKLINELYKLKNKMPVSFEPLLLRGETGVGKTLIARWIHGKGKKNSRFLGEFKEINASGLSLHLMETELFGYKKGAFTDAKQDKPGIAFLAIGGVLFLDEIGDIPLELQPRIMKFIEENTFIPDGWTGNPFYCPLLIIAATNRDLEEMIQQGRFRHDFYARFRHRIRVPTIAERKESFTAIIDMQLQNTRINRNIKYVSYKAVEKLKNMTFPENFRGLERTIRIAVEKTNELGLDILLAECIPDG